MSRRTLVQGVGINDADYKVSYIVNGERVRCPFYRRWEAMLMRCYSDKYKDRQPTYIDCKVTDEWLTFSNFKKWMETQDWNGKQLDKDLLVKGNKIYSPSTCVFVDGVVNSFTTDKGKLRGEWPIGVYFNKVSGKFLAQCGNPFTKKLESIGFFDDPQEGHLAWKRRKHELSCSLAELQTDERLKIALMNRYK